MNEAVQNIEATEEAVLQARVRQQREIDEFYRLFPEEDIDDVPSDVWRKVKNGAALADSYAAYQIEARRALLRAKRQNEYNAEHSAGRIDGAPSDGFFTASQVAKMSEKEVRANYRTILESMKSKYFYDR